MASQTHAERPAGWAVAMVFSHVRPYDMCCSVVGEVARAVSLSSASFTPQLVTRLTLCAMLCQQGTCVCHTEDVTTATPTRRV